MREHLEWAARVPICRDGDGALDQKLIPPSRLIMNDDGLGKAIVKRPVVAVDECEREPEAKDSQRENVTERAFDGLAAGRDQARALVYRPDGQQPRSEARRVGSGC